MEELLNSPLVSIIMPCYNVEKFVALGIQSIFEQTYRNIELVCLDDGSTDNTYDIIYDLSKKYNIKLIRQNNNGILSARREAIKHASGDYIALVDADDVIEYDAIEKSIDIILSEKCDAVSWEFYSTDHEIIKPLLTYSKELEVISGWEAFTQSIGGWSLTGIGVFKKEKYEQAYSVYDAAKFSSHNADEYITRIVFHGLTSIAKAKIKYFYYINPESSSRKFRVELVNSNVTNMALKRYIVSCNELEGIQVKIIDQYAYELINSKNNYIKNKKKLDQDMKKHYIKTCLLAIDDFSNLEYLYWFISSKVKFKVKIRLILSILFFKVQN